MNTKREMKKKCLHKIKEPIAFFRDTDESDYPEVLILQCPDCLARFSLIGKKNRTDRKNMKKEKVTDYEILSLAMGRDIR